LVAMPANSRCAVDGEGRQYWTASLEFDKQTALLMPSMPCIHHTAQQLCYGTLLKQAPPPPHTHLHRKESHTLPSPVCAHPEHLLISTRVPCVPLCQPQVVEAFKIQTSDRQQHTPLVTGLTKSFAVVSFRSPPPLCGHPKHTHTHAIRPYAPNPHPPTHPPTTPQVVEAFKILTSGRPTGCCTLSTGIRTLSHTA
jgi:hypothetical protein